MHNFKQLFSCWWGRSRRGRDGTTCNNNRATPSGSVVWRYHEEAVGAFSFASCTYGY
ncbi:MAG: hypothetical protein IKP43_01355 [Bacteroidaceae bacterium]|nr:hypothetical protein [Bacteroidaceae bacterium]